MTPQKVNRVAKLPEWTTVLVVMIKSRRADLAFQTNKQERWNQRAQDRQAYQDFLEEHRNTSKFSGKYAPQPQHTELIWTMPWGCWVELEDKNVHCKEWMMMIAFIIIKSSLVPLIEGLCAQIYFRFEISVVCSHLLLFFFVKGKTC